MNCDTAKSHVFPYVDGELSPELRQAMEAHLSGCDSCRRCAEQELAFRAAYVVALRPDPAPAHLRQKVERLLGGLVTAGEARRRKRYRAVALATAAVLLLALGVTLGLNASSMLQRRAMLTALTEASVDQHQKLVRGLLPRDIAGVSPKTAEQWFRERLDFNVSLPELKHANLTLLGARISHLAHVEVAALEYQVDGKHVSLFIIPEEAYTQLRLSEKPKFKIRSHRGYDIIIWRHHGTGYTLVSDIGSRSCLVCHSPDDKLEEAFESRARL